MADLTPIIKESFLQYSGAVLQSRALVDVRDGLKPSARQIFYSMLQHKLVHANPHKKTANAVGMAMAEFYIHGNASCTGVIMRAGQPFSMRYPLVDVKGNAGTLMESGNWAAERYTESRLSALADYLFKDIDKETITEWRDSYDNTNKYPAVLPSKGFYNLVNGSTGIGIGMASSIPEYNLRELNEALIKLLWNPDIDFEEIFCAPDFATGAILLNLNEVKESMRNGRGASCKLRSVVDFDQKDRCFVVTQIPYGVYTNTICRELEEIEESEENPGIEKHNDLTGKEALIKIYLTKSANPDKVLRYLYKNTSLQYYFGINFTILDKGRYPRVFTWKEMLQAHLDHEHEVYLNGYNHDLKKITARLHILEGLLKAIYDIDAVINGIRAAEDSKKASLWLQNFLKIDAEQAKAILDIKLSRLAHLEVSKLEDEQEKLTAEKTRIETILGDEVLFKKEIEKGLREVADKFGDARRTKVLDLKEDGGEPIEVKTIQLSLTNQNSIFTTEVSTLYTQKRGGVGNKIKLNKNEYITSTLSLETNQTLLFFSRSGNYYSAKASNIPVGEKIVLESLLPLKDGEEICAVAGIRDDDSAENKYIIFMTKNGFLKKSALSEYKTNRNVGVRALNLEDDEIVNVLFTTDEKIGIVTKLGNFLIIMSDDIRAIGRVARGIKGIKLNDGDEVVAAHIIPADTTQFVSISASGLSKRTSAKEFAAQGKNTKGARIQKLVAPDTIIDFTPINQEKELLIGATNSCIKLSLNEVPLQSRDTVGVKTIKLPERERVIGLTKF